MKEGAYTLLMNGAVCPYVLHIPSFADCRIRRNGIMGGVGKILIGRVI